MDTSPLTVEELIGVARKRRRSLRWIVAGLAFLAMTVLVVDALVMTHANAARPVTLGTALQRFRAAHLTPAPGPESPAAAAGTLGTPPAGTGVAPTAAGSAASAGVEGAPAVPSSAGSAGVTLAAAPLPAPATGRSQPGTGTPTAVLPAAPAPGPQQPAAAAFSLPPQGVYAYRTSGGEALNVPGSSRSYPSVTYATLTYKGGCEFEIENDVIQQHTDRRWMCSEPGQVQQLAQGRTVSYFGQTEGFDYWCNPPMVLATPAQPTGTARDGVCSDHQGDKATIHETDLGREQVIVGGTPVEVFHLLFTSTLSGMATGTARDELLLTADTGMIVSWHRSVDTDAAGAFGVNAHYAEHANLDLLSLVPQT